MKKILPFFIFFILFTTFFNCSKSADNKLKKDKDFVRDWKVLRYPYSNAVLSLFGNNEFKYSETGHTSELYSEGLWSMKNDTLILNSLRPNECLYIDDFSLNEKETFESMKTTLKNCNPKPNSKFFTEFNNSKFIVKTDSLIYLNLNSDYKRQYGNYKIY
ncbi:hypothetical protein [Epilithonimonas xixisoli]|uniref:Uncharacterized protein n=1 Tax=Epilithonimonas xixisoli TaxID=1476462 RepID=A0A4R8IB05_9FLAO|nr:hypothetical protein [Epilithonimonas xixisoli]TDX84511.1 hypothetical protein B0I22_2132 [Epilithonimonas xixisoli]